MHDSVLMHGSTVPCSRCASVQGDLRAETSRREHAEASLTIYKAASLSLGVTALSCAALALLAISRCGTKR